jgi:hypothetical protein
MKTLALILAALTASAALAEQQPAAAVRSAGSDGTDGRLDPNQTICRSEPAVGSRLRGRRICATRAQWLEQMRLERQYVEKAQTTRTFCGGICTRALTHGR